MMGPNALLARAVGGVFDGSRSLKDLIFLFFNIYFIANIFYRLRFNDLWPASTEDNFILCLHRKGVIN